MLPALPGLRHVPVTLPFVLEHRHREQLSGAEPGVLLDARKLMLGILCAELPPSHVEHAPTLSQLTWALRRAAEDMGHHDPDEIAASAAAYLAEHHGEDVAVSALRRACELLPDAVFSRGDLIVRLLHRGRETQFMGHVHEAAEQFSRLRAGATVIMRNEAAVLSDGIPAALFTLGIEAAAELLRRHRVRIDEHPSVKSYFEELGVPM